MARNRRLLSCLPIPFRISEVAEYGPSYLHGIKLDMKNFSLALCFAASMSVGSGATVAQVKSPAPAPLTAGHSAALHPWQVAGPPATNEVYFTDLVDGATIETPYLVTFGLSGGWGLAAITQPVAGKAGHHHLLINRDLPLDFKEALPFNDQYVHFGKGQMESVLTLEPGAYSLRLLLANNAHLPYFVYSKPIKITVSKKNKSTDPKSLVVKGIAFKNLPADGKLDALFKLQFHASGLNVAHLSQAEKDTGHFRLKATPAGGAKPAEIDFVNGQTEVWLSPPPGLYTLKLEFVDNANPGKLLTSAVSAQVRVPER